jgi:hypothetical protein
MNVCDWPGESANSAGTTCSCVIGAVEAGAGRAEAEEKDR